MVKIDEKELRIMLSEYCEGDCYKCRFNGICSALKRYEVEDSQELYNDLMQIALRPQTEAEFKILKEIGRQRGECEMTEDKETRSRMSAGILGLEHAYEVITGIEIDSDEEGVIAEWYTGFPFFPLVLPN